MSQYEQSSSFRDHQSLHQNVRMSGKSRFSSVSIDELSELSESSDSSWTTAPSHQASTTRDTSEGSGLQRQQCHDIDVLTGQLKSFELGPRRGTSRLSRSARSLAPSPSGRTPRFLSAEDSADSGAGQDEVQTQQQRVHQSELPNQETQTNALHEATQAGYDAMLNQIQKERMDISRRRRSRLIRARYVDLGGQSSLSSQGSQLHTNGVLKNVQTHTISGRQIRREHQDNSGRRSQRVSRRSHQINQRASASNDFPFEDRSDAASANP